MTEAEAALMELVELIGIDEVSTELQDAPDEGDFDFPNQGCRIGSLKLILAEYERIKSENWEKLT